MASTKMSPTLAVQRCKIGPGVLAVAACDTGESTTSLATYQERFIARRMRLKPGLARIVAGLAFEDGRRA